MIIDGHAHACGDYLNTKSIIEKLDKNKVDKVVLVPGEYKSNKTYSLPKLAPIFPDNDTVKITNLLTRIVVKISKSTKYLEQGNEYVHKLAIDFPNRIIQFYWVLLSNSFNIKTVEEKYEQWGFKGIKLHQCWENFTVRSTEFENILKYTEKMNLPLFIHLRSHKEVLSLINILKERPGNKIIIEHLFGVELFANADIDKENLYFDISNTYLVSTKRLCKAIDRFGVNKFLLGSDTPYGMDSLRLNIERVNSLPLSNDEKNKILGNNMLDLLSE